MEPYRSQSLYKLLLELFTADELRLFLRRLPYERDLTAELPSGAVSLAQLVYEATELLYRHGLVDAALFRALVQERPGRAALVGEVAQTLGVEAPTLPELEEAFFLAGEEVADDADAEVEPASDRPTPVYRSDEAALSAAVLSRAYAQQAWTSADAAWEQQIIRAQRTLRAGGELQPGDRLAGGRLQLIERLWFGEFTAFWLAWDEERQARAAIRVLFREWTAQPANLDRLRRVTDTLLSVRHPGLVPLLVPPDEEGGYWYLATPWREGGSLHQRIHQGALPPEGVLPVLTAMLDALRALHGASVLHLNLTPRTVLFDAAGAPALTDVGLWSPRSADRGVQTVRLGSLVYSAPELAEGATPDARADLWSVGVVGLCAWRGAEPTLREVMLQPEALVSLVPAPLQDLWSRLIDPDPRRRPERVDEVLAELAGPAPVPSPPPAAAPPALEARTSPVIAEVNASTLRFVGDADLSLSALEPNPFRPALQPGSGDEPPGRSGDLRRLLARVDARGSALVVGPRRSGKSWLLGYLGARLRLDHPVYSCSLQSKPCDTPDRLAASLAPALRGSPEPALAFEDLLRDAPGWPVVLLDEVGFLRQARLDLHPAVFGWLRGLGEELCSVIYAGSARDWRDALGQAQRLPGSSFGNDLETYPLGPLSEEAALAFLQNTAPRDVPISPDGPGRWIVARTGTWPFYLQVMGHALVERVREGRRFLLRDERPYDDLYRSAVLGRYEVAIQDRWRDLPEAAQQALLATDTLPPAWSACTPSEQEALRDAGLYAHYAGWLLMDDLPLCDWIATHRDELLKGQGVL